MESERVKIERLQLAFSGWLPALDNEPIESDDWHTPPELVHEIAEWFGGSIDLDPCWSPLSFVRPRVAYVDPAFGLEGHIPIRTDGMEVSALDGLAQPWIAENIRNRFVNPPYSNPAAWIRKLAELHASAPADVAGESLALVRIDTSTLWWQLAWEASAICWLRFRVPFVHPGCALRSQPRDHHALIYWGQHAEGFCEWWDFLGHCERPRPTHEPTADELCAQLVDLGHLRIVDGQFALVRESFAEEDSRRESDTLRIDGRDSDEQPIGCPCAWGDDGPMAIEPSCPWHSKVEGCSKHGVIDCEECADAITAVDEPIVDFSPLAESPQAWPAVTPTVHCTCPTLPCPKHPQQGGHGGDGRGAT